MLYSARKHAQVIIFVLVGVQGILNFLKKTAHCPRQPRVNNTCVKALVNKTILTNTPKNV